jgi:hypothetical protein
MRTTLIAALLCTTSMLLPCAWAQQHEADRQALGQLRAEAEKGEAHSQFQIGLAFYLGRFGLATNYMEAAKWIRKAAEQNLAQAQFNLGACYANGQGVAQDVIDAYAWLSLASKTIEPALRGRDALARRMTPEQLTRAQQRATALSAEIEAN